MVLSNSLGTTHAMWEPQVPALREHFAVLRYDHPGHGEGRGEPPVRSVEGLARRRACDPRRARDLPRLVLRAVAGRCGGHVARACTRPSASTASCWPARPRASARARTGCSAPRPCASCGHGGDRRRRAGRSGSRRARTAPTPALVSDYRAMMVSAEREGYAGCCEALADWEPGRAHPGDPRADARARRRARIRPRRPRRARRSSSASPARA